MKKECVVLIIFFLFFPFCASWASGSYYLSPTSGEYDLDSNITVSLVVGTGGDAIGAGDGSISYSTDTLELISISKGSAFTFWNQGPSGSGGLIAFSGGRPNPGFSGNGSLISMVFHAKALGTAQVKVLSGKLYLISNTSQNILTGLGQTNYNIKESTEDKIDDDNEKNKQKPVTPNIISETHPLSDFWYANKNIKLSWNKDEGVTDFSYDLNQTADTMPDTEEDTQETTLEKYDLADGIWYFHLRAKNSADWSETSHYQFKIDTQPPRSFIFDIHKNKKSPYLNLAAYDDNSGIDYFSVFINNKILGKITPKEAEKYFLPFLQAGSYQISMQAVDKAGNAVSDYLVLNVTGKKAQTVYTEEKSYWPFYVFGIAIGLLTILSSVTIYHLYKLEKMLKKQKKKHSTKKK
ncbi:MAG: cohesin domain-containing protein [Patescibacteria group bacterium]|jgi:hypothetical protein